MTGIYKITDKTNGKIYIGQSCNIEKRLQDHKYHATCASTPAHYIDRAIKKRGVDSFDYEVIEECNIEDLNEREIYWIKYFDSSNSEKGYNLSLGGKGVYKHSRDEINNLWNLGLSEKEISEKLGIPATTLSTILTSELNIDKAGIRSRSSKLLQKKIEKYSLDGEYIQTYDSAKEAASSCNKKDTRNIRGVCVQEDGYKSAYGYLWKYEEDSRPIEEWVKRRKYQQGARIRPISQYTQDFRLIATYTCSKEASEKTGIRSSNILASCKGNQWTAGGYIWRYIRKGDKK